MTDPEDSDAAGALGFGAQWEPVAGAVQAWAALQTRGPLGRSVETEDLVQEVCFHAYRSFGSYDPARGEFRPWVFGVASRVAASLLRKAARTRARAGSVLRLASRADALPAVVTTVSRRVARDEGLQRFVERVHELDEDDRQLLVYRGLEGLAHADVAALLDLTPAQANKRWQRLRERLRDAPTVAALLQD